LLVVGRGQTIFLIVTYRDECVIDAKV